VYIARSRHGAPNELARRLVAAGLADRPMVIRNAGLAGNMTWSSFHAAATWTFNEGDQPLHRVRHREPPEGLFAVRGTKQKCVSSPPVDAMETPPIEQRETEAPASVAQTQQCDECDASFLPARPWSRFCSPACRLRAHRSLVGNRKHQPQRPIARGIHVADRQARAKLASMACDQIGDLSGLDRI